MRRKIYGMLAVVVAVVTLHASSAQAIGIGPRLGYQRTVDADEGNFMGGIAARAMLLPFLGVEGSLDYRQDSMGEGDPLTVRTWPVQVTGLVYPLPVLYGALGAGWYNTAFDFDSDVLEDSRQQDFGWHVGGGLQFPMGSVGALAADVRYVFLNMEFEDIPEIPERDSDFYMLTVAMFFGL